jgi:putative aldouronate transport system permease protein
MEREYPRRGGKRWSKGRALQAYSLAALPLLSIFVFSYLPMFGIIIAFKNYRYDLGVLGSEWLGLKNFVFFFQSNDFWRVLRNTIGLNALFIVVGTAASVGLALLLYDLQSRRKTKIFQTILITPHFLSWVVVSYMTYAFLNPTYGLLNNILSALGMGRPDWYSKPGAWPLVLMLASVWKSVGMNSVIYYAALMGVDTSYIEAAQIDGASWRQVRRHIQLPSIMPIVSVLTILAVGGILRADFGLFYQLTRDVGTLYPTTDVIDTYVFRAMRTLGNMGISSAVGLFQSAVGFVLVVASNYFSKKVDADNALF